jgi:hypothetical protein
MMMIIVTYFFYHLENGKNKLHVHSYDKPIVSQYVSFNTRDIVYECKCGKRTIKRVYKSFSDPFPIQTTLHLTNEELKKIVNNNNN